MQVKPITLEYAVAAQITPADVASLKAQGFRTIMCNRPDDEDPGQPSFEEIAAEARALGLETCHLPVATREECEGAAAGFARVLDELPKPVLAYCRSGTRSAILWQMANAAKR